MRTRMALSGDASKIKEKFFSVGTEFIRPINIMIADSYPAPMRDKDKNVAEEYDRARNRARALLYEQRNIVQERWLPRYEVTHVGKHVENEDWTELKELLVDGALDRLAERLIAMCPLMVKKEYVETTEIAVARVCEAEKNNLTEYLKAFHVKRIKGVLPISEEYA